MVCPTASADPDGIANAILEERKEFDKPIIVVNMGGPSFEKANDALRKNGVPTYVFPETAVTALKAMTEYAKLEDRIYDDVVENITDVDKDAVKAIFEKVVADGRDTLLGSEAYAVAEAYGISAAPIKLSTSADEAAELAEEMEFQIGRASCRERV